MFILTILFTTSGLVLAGISIPLILGKIPPNGLYGFRVKKTIENPDIWYPANAYAGKWLLATGLCMVLAALVLALIPGITIDVYSYGILLVWGIVFTIALVASFRYLKSL
jgi:hypothetical protein